MYVAASVLDPDQPPALAGTARISLRKAGPLLGRDVRMHQPNQRVGSLQLEAAKGPCCEHIIHRVVSALRVGAGLLRRAVIVVDLRQTARSQNPPRSWTMV